MKSEINKKNLIINEIDQFRIESICKRLKNSVTQIEIVNWLKNFKTYEIGKALSILEKLEFITENEIIELYDSKLKNILEYNQNNIIIHAVCDYGKSSTLMVYYLKKHLHIINLKNVLHSIITILILNTN